MPHERIYSLDGDPDHPNNVQVAWGHPSSPSNTGPGHGNEDGHVMIAVERPGTPARTACSVEEVKRRVASCVHAATQHLVDPLDPAASEVVARDIVKAIGVENLSYAFGAPLELLAVTIDRKGCNKAIAALRRGRDAAFGKDE